MGFDKTVSAWQWARVGVSILAGIVIFVLSALLNLVVWALIVLVVDALIIIGIEFYIRRIDRQRVELRQRRDAQSAVLKQLSQVAQDIQVLTHSGNDQSLASLATLTLANLKYKGTVTEIGVIGWTQYINRVCGDLNNRASSMIAAMNEFQTSPDLEKKYLQVLNDLPELFRGLHDATEIFMQNFFRDEYKGQLGPLVLGQYEKWFAPLYNRLVDFIRNNRQNFGELSNSPLFQDYWLGKMPSSHGG